MFHKRTYFKTKCGKVGVEATVYEDGSRMAIFEWRGMGGIIDRSHLCLPASYSDGDILAVVSYHIRQAKAKAKHVL